MNALVKKEIRSILPGWIAILLLESVIPWFSDDPMTAFITLPFFFFLGMAILAIDSFGREFSSGTFSLLLSQPIERKQIWRTKIIVLFIAVASIFIIYFASCWLRLHLAHRIGSSWILIQNAFWYSIVESAIAALVAVTGALWTTLLLRQTATAFWIAFLAPLGLATIIVFFIPEKYSDAWEFIFFPFAILYSGFGFWFARKLFYRAQDVGWTGGAIAFSRWRYFESDSESFSAARWRRPMRALFRKEFQLHSIALVGAGILLGLHIVVFFLRAFYANSHKNSTAAVISDFFWVLWLVMPLMVGCMAVAEERKLAVMDEQFCLPVSRRLQFLIKFLPTMFFGILIGGIMPLLMEGIAKYFGDGNEIFTPETHPNGNFFNNGLFWFKICVISLSAGFALAAFFGSTLAKNFLQALSITIITIVGCVIFVSFVSWVDRAQPTFFGIVPWRSILPILIALLVVPTALIWLSHLNFNHFQESKRLWRRNVLGISGALLFIIIGSAAIYNRAWEIFEPAEAPHGAAKFSSIEPPELRSGLYESFFVRFSDGRIWYDNLDEWFYEEHLSFRGLLQILFRPSPKSAGPQQFIGGADSSNWLDAAGARIDLSEGRKFGYLDTVGVKDNGTLWISEKSAPQVWSGANMVQFGDATDWQQIVDIYHGFLLLKKNGTIWYWGFGTNRIVWNFRNWPTVRNFQPKQIGTDSDWKEIFPSGWMRSARKSDGTVWMFDTSRTNDFSRETNWDNVNLQTFSQENNASAYVGEDGTLRIRNGYWKNNIWYDGGYLQVGNEKDWHAVSVNDVSMVALKADGTLWKWEWKWNFRDSPSSRDVANTPPSRLGIHRDWIGLTSTWNGSISLAADGSLWFWPDDYYEGALLKNPKQPEFLGNVFTTVNK